MGTDIFHEQVHGALVYRVVFRFASLKELEEWEKTEKRAEWLRTMQPLLMRRARYNRLTGMETWFTLSPSDPIIPPPRYKMAAVTWLAITPTLIVFNYLFGPWLQQLPLVPRFVLSTPWIVLAMTYMIMPQMSRIFFNWLYPPE